MDLCYPAAPLTGPGVRIRPWRLDDLDCVAAASTDPAIPPGTTVPAVPSTAAGREFLLRQLARIERGDGISQAIAEPTDDRAIGLIYLARRPQPWIAGLGYWLIPEARGHRLAARAIELLAAWTLRELGVRRLEAWVAPDNVASQRTLGRAGFTFEGRLRQFLHLAGRTTDGLVYSRVAGDPANPDDTDRPVRDPGSATRDRGPSGGQPCR